MSNQPDYFRQHPREGLQLILVIACGLWQTGIAVVGLFLYLLLGLVAELEWWLLIGLGAISVSFKVVADLISLHRFNILSWLHASLKINANFCKISCAQGLAKGSVYLLQQEAALLVGFSFIFAGIILLIDSLFVHPHQKAIDVLKNNKIETQATVEEKVLQQELAKLDCSTVDGTALGISLATAKPVVIHDEYLNHIILVLGTTGSGKTITMRRFYRRAITQGYPLIIIDGKPTEKNVEWVQSLAKQYNRRFYGFNCSRNNHYNSLANGGHTELKDKVITLKDEWSSDHYRSLAEDYLQTAFEVLIKVGEAFTLSDVAACLSYDTLCVLVRRTNNQELMRRVEGLSRYDKNELTGLQAHLHIILHSELGDYFKLDDSTFTLADIIEGDGIVYFALPALKFPSFSKVLGKLVVNDLKTVIDSKVATGKKIFTSLDEYSVFAGEQSLNIANMGREKGLHVLFGTQGLADLEKVDKTFLKQITNCANTIICHRLNDHDSAEVVAKWAGTEKKIDITAQIDISQTDGGVGSVRNVREFGIHPDEIKKELGVGEAFVISKVDGFGFQKVRVKYT